MVETAVLPMMAWSVHRQIVDFFWTLKLSDADSRGPSLTEADVDMRGPVKDKWCLLTASVWTLVLPVFMAASFVFHHIPGLDAYLEQRYGDEFVEYAKKTKKFMPFVY